MILRVLKWLQVRCDQIGHNVGNKAKGRISKRVFQESKAGQNFQKANISYLLIRTRACVYRGVRNVSF